MDVNLECLLKSIESQLNEQKEVTSVEMTAHPEYENMRTTDSPIPIVQYHGTRVTISFLFVEVGR